MLAFDFHTHLFPTEIIHKRDAVSAKEKAFGLLYGNPKSKMIDETGLAEYMNRETVSGTVAMGFPFTDGGLVRLCNDYILDAAKRDNRIVPFIMVDRSNSMAALAEAERCLGRGARGVGELAYYETCFSDGERRVLDGLADLLEENSRPLVLHLNEQVGHEYPGKGKADFATVVAFVHDHPRLKVILAHMGGGICFYEFMPEIRKSFANVHYDLAAVPFLYSEEIYDFAARYIPSKVLFGSDFPLLSLKRYERHLKVLSEETRQMFLSENGRRLLGT
jgi:uncharacterized protein